MQSGLPDKVPVIAMATVAFRNLLKFTKDTIKGSVDEIQSNGSLLQGERRENPFSTNAAALEWVEAGKQNLNAEKNIIKKKHYWSMLLRQ